MTESLRDPSIGPEWLAFYALTKDEPIEHAYDYIRTAYKRLQRGLAGCRGPNGERLLSPEVELELSGLCLVLIGLAQAADPAVATPVNLKLTPRKGRPKRNIVKIVAYRRAAHEVLARKSQGYDAALTEVSKETGLDRTEIEAWASHIERQMEQFGKNGLIISG